MLEKFKKSKEAPKQRWIGENTEGKPFRLLKDAKLNVKVGMTGSNLCRNKRQNGVEGD